MCDFSFCVPSREKENSAKNGTLRWSVFPPEPFSENFLNKLWWEMTLFEFNSPKDRPQNSVQEQWILSWGGMKAWRHGWGVMNWDIPNPPCAEREEQAHTHSPQKPHLLITLYHLQKPREAKYTPYRRSSEVSCRCRQILENKTFITTWVFSSILAKTLCPHFHR